MDGPVARFEAAFRVQHEFRSGRLHAQCARELQHCDWMAMQDVVSVRRTAAPLGYMPHMTENSGR